jgi:hypothetical protein
MEYKLIAKLVSAECRKLVKHGVTAPIRITDKALAHE